MMTLAETDVRSIIRLLGETAMVRGHFNDLKNYLMNGLSELVKADAWIWALGCQIEPKEPQVFVNFIHGGFAEERFTKYLAAVEHPDMAEIASKFAENIKENRSITTMRRDEIDSENLANDSEAGKLWEAANINHLMLSGYPIDETSLSTIGLYRSVGKERFTEREKKIAHIVLGEVRWLHLSGWPEDKGAQVPKLYPRQRVVLNLLLEGYGRKKIADQMGITEHTVSGYIKDIYKNFSVNSQVELMKNFFQP